MAIVEIKIDTIEPFADGHAFGEAGSYLRIKGIAMKVVPGTSCSISLAIGRPGNSIARSTSRSAGF